MSFCLIDMMFQPISAHIRSTRASFTLPYLDLPSALSQHFDHYKWIFFCWSCIIVYFHVFKRTKQKVLTKEKTARAAVQTCCCCCWFFGMLGFPDSITPVVTAIIYEAGKHISGSGGQQLARSQHTACRVLCPFYSPPLCLFPFFHPSLLLSCYSNLVPQFSFFFLHPLITDNKCNITTHTVIAAN